MWFLFTFVLVGWGVYKYFLGKATVPQSVTVEGDQRRRRYEEKPQWTKRGGGGRIEPQMETGGRGNRRFNAQSKPNYNRYNNGAMEGGYGDGYPGTRGEGVQGQVYGRQQKTNQMRGVEDRRWRVSQKEVVGLDCEMVGIGPQGKGHTLARVSIVNIHGHTVYDSYVRPQAEVTDYRTFVSGIEEHHLRNAPSFTKVQDTVRKLIAKCILVGHGLENDLKILRIDHPQQYIRDTAYYNPLRRLVGLERAPPLKLLVETLFRESFQDGAHDSVQDALYPVRIYLKYREQWDEYVCRHPW